MKRSAHETAVSRAAGTGAREADDACVADDVAEMVITGQYHDHPDDTAFRANALVHP